MKRLFFVLVILLASLDFAETSDLATMIGAVSPYTLSGGLGELSTINNSEFYDSTGRTYKNLGSLTGTTAVVVVVGQSNVESIALGTYSTVNSTNWNFNIADRGVYNCANPVLGTPYLNPPATGGNSVNCQIGDGLITGAVYNNVIMAPAAVGGSACADWDTGGALHQRILTLYNGLASRGLTRASGFAGDVWILWHQGETDNTNGTARATLATCYRNVAAYFSSVGFGATRFFVATESMVANVTAIAVTGAQADAVASGCSTCRAGMNVDSLTGPTNRQADGTHPTAAMAISMASSDVTIITNCKNTSC